MANDVADKEITDTNKHTFTIERARKGPESAYQYVNGLDAKADVTVYATYDADDNFNDAIQLAKTTGIAANGGTDFNTVTQTPWDQLQFEVQAQSTPSSGSFTIKEHE